MWLIIDHCSNKKHIDKYQMSNLSNQVFKKAPNPLRLLELLYTNDRCLAFISVLYQIYASACKLPVWSVRNVWRSKFNTSQIMLSVILYKVNKSFFRKHWKIESILFRFFNIWCQSIWEIHAFARHCYAVLNQRWQNTNVAIEIPGKGCW